MQIVCEVCLSWSVHVRGFPDCQRVRCRLVRGGVPCRSDDPFATAAFLVLLYGPGFFYLLFYNDTNYVFCFLMTSDSAGGWDSSYISPATSSVNPCMNSLHLPEDRMMYTSAKWNLATCEGGAWYDSYAKHHQMFTGIRWLSLRPHCMRAQSPRHTGPWNGDPGPELGSDKQRSRGLEARPFCWVAVGGWCCISTSSTVVTGLMVALGTDSTRRTRQDNPSKCRNLTRMEVMGPENHPRLCGFTPLSPKNRR